MEKADVLKRLSEGENCDLKDVYPILFQISTQKNVRLAIKKIKSLCEELDYYGTLNCDSIKISELSGRIHALNEYLTANCIKNDRNTQKIAQKAANTQYFETIVEFSANMYLNNEHNESNLQQIS